jgi:hypothetical protein
MKFALRGALLASVFLAAVPALAQTPAQQQGAAGGAVSGAVGGAVVGAVVGGPIGAVIGGVVGASAGGTVGTLTADDGVYVQRYVYERQVQPVVLQERVEIGQPLPATVATYQFEGNPRLAPYRYAYVNKQYLLVDSKGHVMGSIVR